MKDSVNAVLAERQELERGLLGSTIASGMAHVLVVGAAVGVSLLSPKEPLMKISSGFAAPIGGYGTPNAAPAAPAPAAPVTQAPAPKPEPPAPQIIKPPQELPRKGLADIDEKTSRKKPEKTPVAVATGPTTSARSSASAASATPGISLTAPVGAGIPGGTDLFGDWYMTGVQRKLWIVWAQQMRAGMPQPVIVSFTILADGSVTDVHVVQSSTVYLLDNAAQRAIISSAPFGPLPKDYGTNRITIQCVFKPGE